MEVVRAVEACGKPSGSPSAVVRIKACGKLPWENANAPAPAAAAPADAAPAPAPAALAVGGAASARAQLTDELHALRSKGEAVRKNANASAALDARKQAIKAQLRALE